MFRYDLRQLPFIVAMTLIALLFGFFLGWAARHIVRTRRDRGVVRSVTGVLALIIFVVAGGRTVLSIHPAVFAIGTLGLLAGGTLPVSLLHRFNVALILRILPGTIMLIVAVPMLGVMLTQPPRFSSNLPQIITAFIAVVGMVSIVWPLYNLMTQDTHRDVYEESVDDPD